MTAITEFLLEEVSIRKSIFFQKPFTTPAIKQFDYGQILIALDGLTLRRKEISLKDIRLRKEGL